MALLDADTLLLTVGDFGFDGLASVHAYPQDPPASYGKTIAINIRDGYPTIFTAGHRNPQGLYVDPSGTIWSTEHGPQGGDELNRLVRGANYGWPYATYGTDYGSFSWPLNKREAEQKGYLEAVPIGSGIRYIIEGHDGSLLLWTDDQLLISLRPRKS
ncbi:glucose/arabinose dehydrogenase [Bradyrhizobium ottawaense]|uniref:PQQ-dependent sugar dehydrogenase n=1 Tax=Bradyrhizobium ottawaense TaxID=931866 RepID=UPI003838E6E4